MKDHLARKKFRTEDKSGNEFSNTKSGYSDPRCWISLWVIFGKPVSNIDGALVANDGGKSSMPGKREFRKWPSNKVENSCRLITSSLWIVSKWQARSEAHCKY